MLDNPTDIASPDYLSGTLLYEIEDLDRDIRASSGGLDTRYSSKQSVTLNAAGNQYNYLEITRSRAGTVETFLDSLIVPTSQEITYELTF